MLQLLSEPKVRNYFNTSANYGMLQQGAPIPGAFPGQAGTLQYSLC